MTDATAHNKKLAVAVAEKTDREEPAGQLFCNVHTTLGFDCSMKEVVHDAEAQIGMENIFSGEDATRGLNKDAIRSSKKCLWRNSSSSMLDPISTLP